MNIDDLRVRVSCALEREGIAPGTAERRAGLKSSVLTKFLSGDRPIADSALVRLACVVDLGLEPPAVSAETISLEQIETADGRNPRKAATAKGADDDLAQSILEIGLIEPLVVAPIVLTADDGEPEVCGNFQIIAGHRRLGALKRLADEGVIAADYPVRCTVHSGTHEELLFIAIAENMARADMHPLDEGEAFLALRQAGVESELIAARVGRTVRHIQTRSKLAKSLIEEARDAFRANKFNLAMAEELSRAAGDIQRRVLPKVLSGHAVNEHGVKVLIDRARPTPPLPAQRVKPRTAEPVPRGDDRGPALPLDLPEPAPLPEPPRAAKPAPAAAADRAPVPIEEVPARPASAIESTPYRRAPLSRLELYAGAAAVSIEEICGQIVLNVALDEDATSDTPHAVAVIAGPSGEKVREEYEREAIVDQLFGALEALVALKDEGRIDGVAVDDDLKTDPDIAPAFERARKALEFAGRSA